MPAHLHQNLNVQERSLEKALKRIQRIEGKTAILQTWQEHDFLVPAIEHKAREYLSDLKFRIRKEKVMLEHQLLNGERIPNDERRYVARLKA